MRILSIRGSFAPYSRFLILSTFWLLMQLMLLYQFGIVKVFEAHKYIEQANYFIQHGTYTTKNFLFYSTEILLIAGSLKLAGTYWMVIGVQLIFNALSTLCFYNTILWLTRRNNVAFFFTLAFIWMFYYQLYNVHLFTESLYFSFSVLFFNWLAFFSTRSFPSLSKLLLVLVVLYFTRPVGIYFLPATFVFYTLRFFPQHSLRIFLSAGILLLILFTFLLDGAMSSGGEFDFLLPYTEGHIICGVPSGKFYAFATPVNKNSVGGLVFLFWHNTGLFFLLFFQRLLAFFGVIRSYYSLPHNVFIAGYFYSLYFFSLLGIKKMWAMHKPAISFLLTIIFLTALTSGLSCDEWHNRFIYAVFPFFMMLGSFAFATKETDANKKAVSDETAFKSR